MVETLHDERKGEDRDGGEERRTAGNHTMERLALIPCPLLVNERAVHHSKDGGHEDDRHLDRRRHDDHEWISEEPEQDDERDSDEVFGEGVHGSLTVFAIIAT